MSERLMWWYLVKLFVSVTYINLVINDGLNATIRVIIFQFVDVRQIIFYDVTSYYFF